MSNRRGSSRSVRGRATPSSIPPTPQSNFEKFNLDDDSLNDLRNYDDVLPHPQTPTPPPQPQEQMPPPAAAPPPISTRVPKSDIFVRHFRKVMDDPTNRAVKTGRAICNYCGASYYFKVGNGYGNYTKHMEAMHPTEFGITSSQTQLHGFTGSSDTAGGVQGGVSHSSTSLFQFDQNVHRKLVAKMLAVQHLPFSHVEGFMFNQMIQLGLNPAAKSISRSTATRDLAKVVAEYKFALINIFSQQNAKVSICADIWSDNFQKHSYLGVTCHWIDNSWTLNKRLIAYKDFDTEHSAINIRDKLHDVLNIYSLTNKVFSIGFDNASANTASIEDLKTICQPCLGGKNFHSRCMCHILNLCVQDGLGALKEQIAPIKDCIVYMTRRGSVMKKWKQFCRENGLHPKKISLDVSTRWNSTYKLLKESLQYKDALCQFSSQENIGYRLYSQYWDPCINICTILGIFYEAPQEMSKIYVPTSHVALDYCVKVACVLRENMHNPLLQNCVGSMMEKWLKYFANIPDLFLVAKVFDPRFRLEGLEGLLNFYYNALYPQEVSFDPYCDIRPNVGDIIVRVKQLMIDLFREYSGTQINLDLNVGQQYSTSSSSSSSSRATNDFLQSGPLLSNVNSFLSSFTQPRTRSTNSNPCQELETFLTITFEYQHDEQGDLDLLKWWSRRAKNYPILAVIAREILATPPSTVAVEQAFSLGGYTLDATRSNMTVENVENQCLLDDWVRAENRTQAELEDDQDSEEEWTSPGTGGSDA